jgi:hypothetical protein
MTLPASGSISLGMVNTELNWPSTRVISFNDAYVRQIAQVPSGSFSFSNLRGKTRYPQPFGDGTGPADFYLKTGSVVDSYWEFANNFQTINILYNGTNVYSQSFMSPSTTSVTVGGRTYYRGNLQSGGGILNAYYSFSWVE